MTDEFVFPLEDRPRIATLYASVEGELEARRKMNFINGRYFEVTA